MTLVLGTCEEFPQPGYKVANCGQSYIGPGASWSDPKLFLCGPLTRERAERACIQPRNAKFLKTHRGQSLTMVDPISLPILDK